MSDEPMEPCVPCYAVDIIVRLTPVFAPLTASRHVFDLPQTTSAIALSDTKDGDTFILLSEHYLSSYLASHVCRRDGDVITNCLGEDLHLLNHSLIKHVVIIPPDRVAEVNAMIHKQLYQAGGRHNAWRSGPADTQGEQT